MSGNVEPHRGTADDSLSLAQVISLLWRQGQKGGAPPAGVYTNGQGGNKTDGPARSAGQSARIRNRPIRAGRAVTFGVDRLEMGESHRQPPCLPVRCRVR